VRASQGERAAVLFPGASFHNRVAKRNLALPTFIVVQVH
jgi:hypothetical protein